MVTAPTTVVTRYRCPTWACVKTVKSPIEEVITGLSVTTSHLQCTSQLYAYRDFTTTAALQNMSFFFSPDTFPSELWIMMASAAEGIPGAFRLSSWPQSERALQLSEVTEVSGLWNLWEHTPTEYVVTQATRGYQFNRENSFFMCVLHGGVPILVPLSWIWVAFMSSAQKRFFLKPEIINNIEKMFIL